MSVRFIPGGGTGTGTVANPTALVGLTAVNGAASSAIRSDGAPALDQSITPTWTGTHTWSGTVQILCSSSGSASTPAISVAGNTNTGFFIGSNVVNVTTAGSQRVSFASTVATYFCQLRTTLGRIQQTDVQTGAGPFTTTTSNDIYVINKVTGAATAVTLTASPATGQMLTVCDGKGDAATNNITLTPSAGNIDGSATYVINTNYGVWQGVYTGSIWKTLYSR